MAKLPFMARHHGEIERKIHSALEEKRAKQNDSHDYVRLSGIGKCQRELWAIRQGIPDERPPEGRALMIFGLGDKVEEAVIKWLIEAGYEVAPRGPQGAQWRVEMPGGVGVGHLDGLIRWGRKSDGDWRLLEIKSAKASKFAELEEAGSYAKWNPQYADQIQAYMGGSQDAIDIPSLSDSLVIVFSKDDSRIYSEMIRFDPVRYADLVAKATLVMSSDEIVPRDPQANGQYSKFCKWCSRAAWCYSPMAGVEFDS